MTYDFDARCTVNHNVTKCLRPAAHDGGCIQDPNYYSLLENARLDLLADPLRDVDAWLVEMVEPEENKPPCPRWWHPKHGWMWDANKALRFAREEDASAYIEGQRCLPGKPTKHSWIAMPRIAPSKGGGGQ